MSISRRTPVLVALGTVFLLVGCLSPILVVPSSAPLEGRSYVTTGRTTGEACMSNILGIPLSTDASLRTAMKNAMEMASAQALIEIVVDNRYIYTLFFNRSCTVVHATGIRFSSQPAPYLPPAPAVPPIPPAPGVKPPEPPEPPPVEHQGARQTAPPAAKSPAPLRPSPEPVKAKKLTRAEKRKLAAEKRQAEREARQKTEAAKKAAAPKPVPDQYQTFCKYSPGDKVRVETKSQVIEAEFVGCKHFGIQVKAPGKAPGVIPFEQVWMVKLVGVAKPVVQPVTPITPEPTRPAQSRTPAQPRKPAVPR